MTTIREAKNALRKAVEAKIASLTSEEKLRQSKIVYEKLVNLKVFQSSKRVSIFLSTTNEIDTEPMVRKIFEMGKACFVPRYSKAGMQMVKLQSMDDWQNLPVTKWNIKQPLLKEQREDALETGGLDLIITPAVALTKSGHRLGHGGGYYDKYIENLKNTQTNLPTTVAVALKEQIVEEIPTTSTDMLMDVVLFAE
ncbi:unnamed protein product [Ceutorhynchus assimilis]|uniref:5-formyltetrahydrofolate cyclo-ligase n=1 Tax=Ceutorhynchus assimilis TaxID=467358 RepID=A0A9N9QK90_9CUCU|nr:unnamed protein product [Ceutorhynchus assimilis]